MGREGRLIDAEKRTGRGARIKRNVCKRRIGREEQK